ncbi:HAD family hydrolase [bacterium]|nr:HAD family hydrolase [bacterium]
MTIELHNFNHTTSITELWHKLTPEARQGLQTLRRNLRGVTLDLWGTILTDHPAPIDTVVFSEQRQNFLHEELRQHGFDKTADEIKAAYKHAWEYFDQLWFQQIAFGAEDGVIAMLKFLQAELPAESLARVIDFFENLNTPPPLLDGVQEGVQQLAQKYPLALISDTAWTPGRVLRRILAHYDLLKCFRTLVFSGEVGHTKPHPEMFKRALAGIGVEAGQCLHIGDIQRTDVAGAKAMGMAAAWIHRPEYAGNAQENHSPDLAVTGVGQLAQVLLHSEGSL